MARTTFPDMEQLAHVWAQQDPDLPRGKANGGTISFIGASGYSYGSRVAQFMRNSRGEQCLLYLTQGSSTSTARHIGEFRRAVADDVPKFGVYSLNNGVSLTDMRTHLLREVNEALDYLAKSPPRYVVPRTREARAAVDRHNAFAAFFGFEPVSVDDPQGAAAALAVITAAERAAVEKAARKLARAKAARARDAVKSLPAWRSGDNGATISALPFVAMRVRGDTVETTRGARFPVADAVAAFPLIQKVRERGKDWKYFRVDTPIRLGHFHLDAITAAGDVTAGCHHVKWGEIERLARELELI